MTCDSLLMFCLLAELLAEGTPELVSELPVETTSLHVISTQVDGRVAEVGADVDGVEVCDWSRCELPTEVVARSRDGLSLMASW
jgi:hypothetical protein